MAKQENNFIKVTKENGPMGWVFFTAFVGALVYFVQNSEGFGGFILAILKAIVWPGILLHHVLSQLGL